MLILAKERVYRFYSTQLMLTSKFAYRCRNDSGTPQCFLSQNIAKKLTLAIKSVTDVSLVCTSNCSEINVSKY